MGHITRDCPHCGTKRVAFTSFSEHKKTNTNIYLVPFRCGGCSGGIIAEIETSAHEKPHGYGGDVESFPYFTIHKTYPAATASKAPKYLPDNLSSFYIQAAESLRSGNFDASAMMARKTLEVAVKMLDPDGSGNLYNRIERLAGKNLITPDLREWAHIIRDDGNVAAHEQLPVKKDFSEELLSFTEIFLMYTFSMPNMIKERRHNTV